MSNRSVVSLADPSAISLVYLEDMRVKGKFIYGLVLFMIVVAFALLPIISVNVSVRVLDICTQLGILPFIESLPNGFATQLGENGATLSGGQKQRIAIARALYREPEILILDEATSSLDPTAEQYVQKAVEYLTVQQKTVIIIAHRLSTVQHAHKIIVLHEGELAEEGSHHELITMKERYYNLWAQQMPMEYQVE